MRWTGVTLVAAAALAAVAGAQVPVGSSFTYQGSLENAGVPADGLHDLQFKLFDAGSGGVQIGATVCADGVSVADGLFTVQLDFGTTPFAGEARWLEIGVRADVTPGNCGAGAYTTLAPRQSLTAAPYALYALNAPSAGGFWTANGIHIYKTNSGDVGINTTTPARDLEVRNSVRIAHIQSGPFVVNGPSLLEMKSNAVGIDHPYGSIRFLDGGDVVQGSIEYGAGPGLLDPIAMRFATGGQTRMSIDTAGAVGIGVVSPQAPLHVAGSILSDAEIRSASPAKDSEVFLGWAADGNGADMARIRIGGSGVGASNGLDIQRVANVSLMRILNSGNVGIGTTLPEVRLHVAGGGDVSPAGGGFFVLGGTGSANLGMDNNEIMARSNGAPATLYFNNEGGDVRIGQNASVASTLYVPIIAITGADVAEKIPTSEQAEAVEPGTVMEIDPINAGKLRVSRGAYNRRVAGVVSGAGDLPVGAILGNLPGHENAPAIALSGRVWVKCDAARHAIEPGDLLTTSETAGHAMKVADNAAATGATIGKAMSSLKQGETGLVLVLVNLQ